MATEHDTTKRANDADGPSHEEIVAAGGLPPKDETPELIAERHRTERLRRAARP